MGLDGHPAPPAPGRPMLRKPRRVPPRWGFPFGCEAGTVQWEVERTEGGDPPASAFAGCGHAVAFALARCGRVGPGNFTPSLSQIRT
jgi:hypothetical protein